MLGFLILDILDTFETGSVYLVTGGCHSTYNKIRVDALDGYTFLSNFLSKGGRERINERFGARVCSEHGGWDNPAKRADIQYQSVFPGSRSAGAIT